jgi:glycerol-3-phosphate acyltransferase PlsY
MLYLYAFVVGSFPSAYLIARFVKGIDLRRCGSGTLGMSNLVTHIGRIWIVPICVFDMGVKGASSALLGMVYFNFNGDNVLMISVPLIALIGHNWSCVLKFRGGRGILVIAGALVILDPLLIAVGLVIVATTWFISKKNSPVAVLLGLLILPVVALVLDRGIAVVAFVITGLLVSVIKRLMGNGDLGSRDRSYYIIWRNRLLLDRDILDGSEWIHRNQKGL